MKHLKRIYEFVELSGLSKEILGDIKDICLELQDEGFSISKERYANNHGRSANIDCISIYKGKGYCPGNTFNYNIVKEYIERIKDYMKMNGYLTEVYIHRDEYKCKQHNQIIVCSVRLRFYYKSIKAGYR